MVMKQEKVDLKQLFGDLQSQMTAKLRTNKNNVHHPGTKGRGSELNWIQMLKDYLPERYKVDSAFVVDSNGLISQQIDAVIYDRQYSPFLFNQDDMLYIPAESVYATLEIKPSLDKSVIEYAGEKAESVRRLFRSSVTIKHAGGEYKPVTPFPILAGIVAADNSWKSLGEPFESAISALSTPQRIDFGCALNGGAFEVRYAEDGKPMITKSKPEDSLIFFFLRLVSRLQALGTVPALNVMEYAKVIGKNDS